MTGSSIRTAAAPGRLSASLPDEVLAFLRKHGLAGAGETPAATALSGGVSSDIWRVDLESGPIAVKRALPRLRVAQVWEAPVERNVYEKKWLETANAIAPGIAPKVLASDEAGFFAMEYLGELPLWKAELLAARIDPRFAGAVGGSLATLHAATANSAKLASEFATDANFEAIRLDPYLKAAALAHPEYADRIRDIHEETASTRLSLVHGDISPKNILIGKNGPIFLDAECAWYGDPAFDIAFCLNHLVLKSVLMPDKAALLRQSFESLMSAYLGGVTWEDPLLLSDRAGALLPALMLARVDGKSPVEYLTTEAQKNRVRDAMPRLLYRPPHLEQFWSLWQGS